MTEVVSPAKGRRNPRGTGAFRYNKSEDNYVVWPGRERACDAFIRQAYGQIRHKIGPSRSSNSEDALTWSCFDALRQVPAEVQRQAIADLWELAYGEAKAPDGVLTGSIEIGKRYGEGESTEVDASIEGPRRAGLY